MRFYDDNLNIVWEVDRADGKGTRTPWVSDAKAHNWRIGTTSITGYANKPGSFDYRNTTIPLMEAAKECNWKILKDDPEKWYDISYRSGQNELDVPKILGSKIHKPIEDYFHWRLDESRNLKTVKLYRPYVQAVHEFCQEFSIFPEIGCVEKVIGDDDTWTAGTLDMAGQGFGNDNVVFDWKTQNVKGTPKFYFNYKLQIAAYWKAMGGKGLACIVVLDTSGHPYKHEGMPNVHHLVISNKECKKLYKWYKDLSKIVYASLGWERK